MKNSIHNLNHNTSKQRWQSINKWIATKEDKSTTDLCIKLTCPSFLRKLLIITFVTCFSNYIYDFILIISFLQRAILNSAFRKLDWLCCLRRYDAPFLAVRIVCSRIFSRELISQIFIHNYSVLAQTFQSFWTKVFAIKLFFCTVHKFSNDERLFFHFSIKL